MNDIFMYIYFFPLYFIGVGIKMVETFKIKKLILFYVLYMLYMLPYFDSQKVEIHGCPLIWFNTLTANYEYSRSNRENLPLPIQIKLSKKP